MLNVAFKKLDEHAVHITIGKILGYAYTGTDWQNGYIDTYSIVLVLMP